MWISRVRVNGGFLAGLDVQLNPGLNVFVGPRGAGKTTVLELVRHALGVQHADSATADRQSRLVKSLLGSGEIILELQSTAASKRVVVDANGGGRISEYSDLALMLGQNELEAIASSAENRLHLIDLRATARTSQETASSRAASLTASMMELRTEIEALTEQQRQRISLLADRELLAEREQTMLANVSENLTQRREELRQIEATLLIYTRVFEEINFTTSSIGKAEAARESAEFALSALAMFDKSTMLGAEIWPSIEAATSSARNLSVDLANLNEKVTNFKSSLEQRDIELRMYAEPLRQELEAAEEGLGQLTADLRNVDSQLQHLDERQRILSQLISDYESIKHERNALLQTEEELREQVFRSRASVAQEVTSRLNNRVSIVINHLADSTKFKNALISMLQGSGLQYTALSANIANQVLPAQLLEYVEDGNVSGLASAVQIPEERAAKVVGSLERPEHLATLSSLHLEDSVDFLLHDGTRTKSVELLSTGQKCAVTLPVLLTEQNRTLIMDQPEDHLDNAFLVNNIIRGLVDRTQSGSQTIIATHNPNIPVLGEAESVFVLESDGGHGQVRNFGRFEDPLIVESITSLMEGGREAFKRRAEFYAHHGSLK